MHAGVCTDLRRGFTAPLDAIRSRVTDVLGTYCLDKPPACIKLENGRGRACIATLSLRIRVITGTISLSEQGAGEDGNELLVQVAPRQWTTIPWECQLRPML